MCRLFWKFASLNLLELSGPAQACDGIGLRIAEVFIQENTSTILKLVIILHTYVPMKM
jgi:hypothetical protein